MTHVLHPDFMQALSGLAKGDVSAEEFADKSRALMLSHDESSGMSLTLDDIARKAATEIGARIVKRLGVGVDGETYLLDTGRVMKSTLKPNEAAFAAVVSGLDNTDAPPCIPTFFATAISHISTLTGRRYFFVREEIPDIPDGLAGMDRQEWRDTLYRLEMAWQSKDRIVLDKILADTPLLAGLPSALMWMHDAIGYAMTDLKPDNLGWNGRHLVIRDFSRGEASPHLYRLAAENGLDIRDFLLEAANVDTWEKSGGNTPDDSSELPNH